ncbi:MAG: family 16 glycosylhydrolase [Caldilineaceae bacterium]
MNARFIRFQQDGLAPSWKRHIAGQGHIDLDADGLRLSNLNAIDSTYTNAQIDDYQGLARRNFLWRPPLRLSIRARFSHPGAHEVTPAPPQPIHANETPRSAIDTRTTHYAPRDPLLGTAGFGFWNDPFLMTGGCMPVLPKALWFFYASPPSNMKLALDTPGWGWKAAGIDAARLPFFLLAPTAPIAIPLMRIGALYRRLWPIGQRAIGVCERALTSTMADWHVYTIDWGRDAVHFFVDGAPVHTCDTSPSGPLGLVVWIDNQFMRITPWGELGYGVIARPGHQSLWVDWLSLHATP